ncbi:TPA: hypothetical protein NV714_002332 [Escherichia coli]|nr:hypothetical protein [Escherichia coli]
MSKIEKEVLCDYHILFHDGSEDILLALNVINENVKSSSFEKIEDDLIWLVNGKIKYIFKQIGQAVWEKIKTKNAILVEFTPLGPVSEYVIMLE